ncbi:hypothetical protein AMTR_s00073p00140710 [Amborella trichopoda]|uniref:14-3-3 domain-containing protein n=1 Tax=Amborella trichopoda TaxID=13333 RepID=W1NQT6_AMBTC|nr:hypothetical protein AMTR_s00073p00140710 [Amborella trichopoda]
MEAVAEMAMEVEMTKEYFLLMAKAAEAAERYEEMVYFMKKVVRITEEGGNEDRALNKEKRRLLSIAYKKSANTLRASWRGVKSVVDPVRKATIESEIISICSEFLELLDTHFLLAYNLVKEDVMSYMLQGEFRRYLAEINPDHHGRFTAACEAHHSYEIATNVAKAAGTNISESTIRTIATNFSKLKTEFIEPEASRKALRDSIAELNKVEREGHKDCDRRMDVLEENFKKWRLNSSLDDDVSMFDVSMVDEARPLSDDG